MSWWWSQYVTGMQFKISHTWICPQSKTWQHFLSKSVEFLKTVSVVKHHQMILWKPQNISDDKDRSDGAYFWEVVIVTYESCKMNLSCEE